jgi:hypothetical protein
MGQLVCDTGGIRCGHVLAVQIMFEFFSARGPQAAAVLFSMAFGVIVYAFLLYIQGLRISALIRLKSKV